MFSVPQEREKKIKFSDNYKKRGWVHDTCRLSFFGQNTTAKWKEIPSVTIFKRVFISVVSIYVFSIIFIVMNILKLLFVTLWDNIHLVSFRQIGGNLKDFPNWL